MLMVCAYFQFNLVLPQLGTFMYAALLQMYCIHMCTVYCQLPMHVSIVIIPIVSISVWGKYVSVSVCTYVRMCVRGECECTCGYLGEYV